MSSINGMTPLDRTRIEQAAANCGFDLTPELQESCLLLRSRGSTCGAGSGFHRAEVFRQ
ncbi:MAG: hypothetical protein NOF05_08970 [Candidatus Accumulibacter phosphatis]|uniref:Uncharacterized protein n=1 Tax=Candidatus Accumulibacter cognatus TaxID=2954383 RepID=A0A7D5SCT8_9PROT|nr:MULTISPECIES: hypothetical protein [Candidatus Accumulibacter]QLH49439.1 MAG: hypothetical protein HWD57_06340 [Candidatus Accumulibacter cognatus]MBL8400669.1 hypothetical protein [Accumulibacter sp.]MBN8517100.1 hypothetical protein [Accumulibacter sp.]MBO3709307.1 hypothetical protein [Accumulibacter sp.]MCC2866651.1 hypothetical protein [Candidatus Accumulibacter phosphatis]